MGKGDAHQTNGAIQKGIADDDPAPMNTKANVPISSAKTGGT